jgi:ubiquinone/menaquinone biosynthesis C-methylase UbiE
MSADAAEQWRQNAARRAETLGAATQSLLDAAGLRVGQRVLDLAAGSGDTSVLAARVVGPDGAVLAVDISEPMLAAAAQAAREAGLSNITTRVADIATLELEPEAFDAAISRLGLMFVDDLPAALGRVRRALKPGGRLAALVWSALEHNVYFRIPLEAAAEAGYPRAGEGTTRRAFSLAEPAVLQQAFETAGFSDVRVQAIHAPRMFGSVDEALGMLRAGPIAAEILELMSPAEVDEFWRRVRQRLESLAGPAGALDLTGEVLLAAGACS